MRLIYLSEGWRCAGLVTGNRCKSSDESPSEHGDDRGSKESSVPLAMQLGCGSTAVTALMKTGPQLAIP